MSTNTAMSAGKNKATLVKWGIILFITVVVSLLPVNDVFTIEIKKFTAISIFAILCFAFETLPLMIASLCIPILYWAFGVAELNKIFSPWAQSSVWMLLAAVLLGNCYNHSGILKRVVFWTMAKTKGSLKTFVYGITLVSVVSHYIGVSSGMVIIFLIYGFAKSLNIKPGSSTAGLLFYTALICASSVTTMLTYDPMFNTCMVMAKTALESFMDVSIFNITYYQYALHNLVFLPEVFFLIFIGTKIFKPEKEMNFNSAFFIAEYDKLGAMTGLEKKSIISIICMFMLFLTQSMTGFDVTLCMLITVLICFIPGIAIGDETVITNTNYSTVFFMAGSMAIGTVANALGVGQMIGDFIITFVGTTPFSNAASVYIIGYIMNLLLTPLAATAVLSGPLALAVYQLGMNPIPVLYGFVQGLNNVLLPYEGALYLLVYSLGYMTVSQFVKVFTVKSIVMLVWLVVFAVPWWLFLGLYQLPV